MKKEFVLFFAVMFVAAVFISCGHPKLKAGEVIGVLYKTDGTRYSENTSVFPINEKDIASGNINSKLNFITNNKGEFKIENVAAGNYKLFILEQPKADNQIGTSNVPMPTFGLIINKGKPVAFTMPVNEGIDLGDIEVTEVSK
jgi:hypothetical protein